MKQYIKELLCKVLGHKWTKLGGGGEKNSGFVFKCNRCKTIGFN